MNAAPKFKHFLGTRDLSREDIETILDTAESFKEISTRAIKKVPTLRGRTVINLFFEPSTRTRTSFEIAGKRLSADVINISRATSSAVKGENLIDTARNLEAMNPDILIVRHSCSGAPQLLTNFLQNPWSLAISVVDLTQTGLVGDSEAYLVLSKYITFPAKVSSPLHPQIQ